MANIVDRVFAEVCLDERIKDGIFRLEEEEHMNALRDYFLKKGITKEAVTHVTNRMVEGRFPERQAYNKDGILVTFPTPQHKAKAIQRGTHFEKNPAPQNTTPPKSAPPEEPEKKVPSPEEKPEFDDGEPPKEKPENDKLPPKSDAEVPDEKSGGETEGGLEIEPPRGSEKPEPTVPVAPSLPSAPRTPSRVAAEKEVVKQIMATDDSSLTNLQPPINEELQKQLHEIYKKCDELGYKEAIKFLTPHVKP